MAAVWVRRPAEGPRSSLRNTERVLDNAGVRRIQETEEALGPALTFADISAEVAGVFPRIMQDGELDAGPWSCGMVAGLIHDIPTCAELIERIVREAETLISERLPALMACGPRTEAARA